MCDSKETLLDKPCQICGNPGFRDLIVTCFRCREAQEHIYCMRVPLSAVPKIWLCEVCRCINGIVHKKPVMEEHSPVVLTINAFKNVLDLDAPQPTNPTIADPWNIQDTQTSVESKNAFACVEDPAEALALPSQKLKIKLMDKTVIVLNNIRKVST